MNGVLWSLVTIVGPLLLIVAIIWAFLRNRNRDNIAEAESGARRLRAEIDEDEARDGLP